ncbi:hypothetical protein Belba_1500 [Belliella baltica DSM 15883]|uniref:Lipoprotein n=1 Tax=Belliella baltica (strain DSM 15883 / CIP 108006 / LMG 21964 / BA134) TaxID=866536 RepID=I3Z4E6_BELBD|nr:hypothetical protein [Belliella baltica]AFL84114.1 hypothetical protein Belba_1500 [Belliella baltica DSM 15883]
MIEKYKKILHQIVKLKFLVSTPLVIFLSAACMEQNNQVCEESTPIGFDITALLVDELDCVLIEQTEQDQQTFKITSQSKFEELLTCQTPLTEIDFENEFIVGGQVKSYQCGSFKEAFSERKCDKIKIGVNIQPQDCTGITDVLFFVSLPIEYLDSDVEFEFIKFEL